MCDAQASPLLCKVFPLHPTVNTYLITRHGRLAVGVALQVDA